MNYLGHIFTDLGRYEKANHYLEEALKIEPNNHDTNYKLCVLRIE